jgi:hypothetical protein
MNLRGGGLKWPGREAHYLFPSGAEVNTAWSYTSTPQYVFIAWWLMKQWIRFHGVVLS